MKRKKERITEEGKRERQRESERRGKKGGTENESVRD